MRATSRRDHLPVDLLEIVTAPLEDPDALQHAVRGCDAVYHLAGRTSALTTPELYRTNGWGSYLLAKACAEATTPPRLVVVSSLAAAGTSISGRLRTERDPSTPVSEYGRSKRAGELAATAWARNLGVSIVRPGIVFGQRNEEMLPMFRSIARFHIHAVPGYQPRRVGLIHHEDLIEILLRVERQGEVVSADVQRRQAGSVEELPGTDGGEGYYVAVMPEFPTYAQLGRMIAQAMGTSRMLVMPISEPVAWLAAASNQYLNRARGRSDSFNLDKIREAFAGDWVGCTQKLQQQLGFQPPRSLQQRLDETAEWYRANGWL
jgi:nucleoside-diphosphate-sugar epimerase